MLDLKSMREEASLLRQELEAIDSLMTSINERKLVKVVQPPVVTETAQEAKDRRYSSNDARAKQMRTGVSFSKVSDKALSEMYDQLPSTFVRADVNRVTAESGMSQNAVHYWLKKLHLKGVVKIINKKRGEKRNPFAEYKKVKKSI